MFDDRVFVVKGLMLVGIERFVGVIVIVVIDKLVKFGVMGSVYVRVYGVSEMLDL